MPDEAIVVRREIGLGFTHQALNGVRGHREIGGSAGVKKRQFSFRASRSRLRPLPANDDEPMTRPKPARLAAITTCLTTRVVG